MFGSCQNFHTKRICIESVATTDTDFCSKQTNRYSIFRDTHHLHLVNKSYIRYSCVIIQHVQTVER